MVELRFDREWQPNRLTSGCCFRIPTAMFWPSPVRSCRRAATATALRRPDRWRPCTSFFVFAASFIVQSATGAPSTWHAPCQNSAQFTQLWVGLVWFCVGLVLGIGRPMYPCKQRCMQAHTPTERTALAAIGARRGWRLCARGFEVGWAIAGISAASMPVVVIAIAFGAAVNDSPHQESPTKWSRHAPPARESDQNLSSCVAATHELYAFRHPVFPAIQQRHGDVSSVIRILIDPPFHR